MRLLAGAPVTAVEDMAARVRPMAESVAMSLWSYLVGRGRLTLSYRTNVESARN